MLNRKRLRPESLLWKVAVAASVSPKRGVAGDLRDLFLEYRGVKLSGFNSVDKRLDVSSFTAVYSRVRELELLSMNSDTDTFALLRAFCRLGDVRSSRRVYNLRRKMGHPLSASHDEFEVLLSSLSNGNSRLMLNQYRIRNKGR